MYGEKACKEVLCWKGAGGLFPCVHCKNLRGDTEGYEFDDEYVVPLSCADAELFDPRTDEDVWFTADTLAELKRGGGLDKDQFEEQQKLMGLNYKPTGLLWDMDLRPHILPISMNRYDPMHTLLVDGLVQTEIELILPVLDYHGISFETIRSFMDSNWVFASALGGKRAPSILTRIFAKGREKHFKKEKTFGCGASEALSVLAPFRYLLESQGDEFQAACANEVRSFCALCHVVGLYVDAKEGIDTSVEMTQALADHAHARGAAHADARHPFKWHMARHLPQQIHRDGCAFDTFPGERYHGHTKEVAYSVKNTISFEKSLTGRLTVNHLRILNEPMCFKDGLLEPIQSLLRVDNSWLSLKMKWQGTLLSENDAVYIDGSLVVVVCCVSNDDEFYIYGKKGERPQRLTAGAVRWSVSEDMERIPLSGRSVRFVTTSPEPDGRMLVVRLY